jgi:hypothetical protein
MNTCKVCKKSFLFFEYFNSYDNECMVCYKKRLDLRDEINNRIYEEAVNEIVKKFKNDNDNFLKVVAKLCIKQNIEV